MFTLNLFEWWESLANLFKQLFGAILSFFGWSPLLLLMLLASPGCGGGKSNMTPEEREKQSEMRINEAREYAKIAEAQGAAWSFRIRTDGRPSVGASTDFYLASDFESELIIFGNAASQRKPRDFDQPLPGAEIPIPGSEGAAGNGEPTGDDGSGSTDEGSPTGDTPPGPVSLAPVRTDVVDGRETFSWVQ